MKHSTEGTLEKYTLLKNFEDEITKLTERSDTKYLMMESIARVKSFNDDQQTGKKYDESLFAFYVVLCEYFGTLADQISCVIRLKMQIEKGVFSDQGFHNPKLH